MSKAKFLNELRNEEFEIVSGGADVKERFVLILQDVGGSKLSAIRVVREIKGIGLKEAKALMDAAPVTCGEYTSEAQVIADKCRLESAGCTVEIK